MKDIDTSAQKDTERAEQFAALPWRRGASGDIEILLVTSRISKHWLLPKGWLMRGKSGRESACGEAYEEAGVQGEAGSEPVGSFDYVKITKSGEGIACRVSVFPLKVETELDTWPEEHQRTRQWFAISEAASLVKEPGLRDFLLGLDPNGF